MDSEIKIYLDRADNKVLLAKTSFDISVSPALKEMLNLGAGKTFFNDAIALAYYGIFYAAKAYLLTKNIRTYAPEEHKKTYEEFKKFVISGELDNELLHIYEAETQKAEVLLRIFFNEKRKRGIFTYNVKSEANIPAAQESIDHAKKFISLLKVLLERA